uniref:Uncharacterized protein n=1 Tax=Cucumis melo TaxID=3656 RepID=A0A9I9ECV9_CUCME
MQVHKDPMFCFYFKDIIPLSKFLDLEVKVLSLNAILILFVDFNENNDHNLFCNMNKNGVPMLSAKIERKKIIVPDEHVLANSEIEETAPEEIALLPIELFCDALVEESSKAKLQSLVDKPISNSSSKAMESVEQKPKLSLTYDVGWKDALSHRCCINGRDKEQAESDARMEHKYGCSIMIEIISGRKLSKHVHSKAIG